MDNNTDYSRLGRVGHFTKNAVENFEENIVSQTNYLEKVERNRENNNSNK